MKTTRSIYTVEQSEIADWNNEEDFPGDCNPIISIDGKDASLTTASLMHAYHYYKECEEDLESSDANTMVELTRTNIEVTEDEWKTLCAKESLSYEDYSPYVVKEEAECILAWSYKYDSKWDHNDDVPGELLRNLSEAFNMRYVCDMAGINYSTFRGFKNNHQGFSLKKTYQLLRCMKSIGDECWNDELEEKFKLLCKGKQC